MEIIEGKSLYKYTLDVLNAALGVGFPEYKECLELKNLRRGEQGFCVLTCVSICLWLRNHHKFDIWVQPHQEDDQGDYIGYAIQVQSNSKYKRYGAVHAVYELAELSIINDVLDFLHAKKWIDKNIT